MSCDNRSCDSPRWDDYSPWGGLLHSAARDLQSLSDSSPVTAIGFGGGAFLGSWEVGSVAEFGFTLPKDEHAPHLGLGGQRLRKPSSSVRVDPRA